MDSDCVDILVVGGGLTGAALMLALADAGYRTALVDARPLSDRIQADFDARTLALSPASIRILNMIQVWPSLEPHATPIETIHVSEQGKFGQARLHAKPNHPLGYVVEMQYISQAFQQLLHAHRILAPATLTALDPNTGVATVDTTQGALTLKASLIVAADGTDSTARRLCGLSVRKKAYHQHAIVANIGLARPHYQQAYERFTRTGPLALLPMTDLRMSLVWTVSPEEAIRLQALDDTAFLKTLQLAFGYRVGRLTKVGRRTIFPLQQAIMPQSFLGKVVFVGNAAHTLHPVAGQGFNLGLRDVAMLAQCIANQGLHADMLKAYQQARRHDQSAIIQLTDGLVNVFTSHIPGLATLRCAGLIAMDNSTILKNTLARYARGFGGQIPDLVCGIPIYGSE